MSDTLHGEPARGGLDDDMAAADAADPFGAPPAMGAVAGTAIRRTALSPAPAPALRQGRRQRWRMIGVVVVLAAAAGLLLAKGIGGSLNYFQTVDQAVHDQKLLAGKDFRLEGLVQPGTVQVHTGAGGAQVVSFIADGTGGHKVAVVNRGNPPTLFKANLPVVVVGHFAGTEAATGLLRFDSTQIIVDHTNIYKAKHPNRVRAPNGTSR